LKPKRDAFVWTAEALCGVIWLAMLLITAFSYASLPGTVAIHFDMAGNADGWGGKGTLWLLVVFSLVLYGILTAVGSRPALWNVPERRREENRRKVYQLTFQLLSGIKCVLMGIFCYTQALVIIGAEQGYCRVGPEYVGAVILVVAVSLTIYAIRLRRIGP
jgi:uncharacterized membrane protein